MTAETKTPLTIVDIFQLEAPREKILKKMDAESVQTYRAAQCDAAVRVYMMTAEQIRTVFVNAFGEPAAEVTNGHMAIAVKHLATAVTFDILRGAK
jgi:hypothetical protein